MEAEFTVIQKGKVHIWADTAVNKAPAYVDGDGKVGPASTATLCSESSQLFQMLVGAFSVERAFKTLEVGLQSNVSLRSSGVVNFNSLVAKKNL